MMKTKKNFLLPKTFITHYKKVLLGIFLFVLMNFSIFLSVTLESRQTSQNAKATNLTSTSCNQVCQNDLDCKVNGESFICYNTWQDLKEYSKSDPVTNTGSGDIQAFSQFVHPDTRNLRQYLVRGEKFYIRDRNPDKTWTNFRELKNDPITEQFKEVGKIQAISAAFDPVTGVFRQQVIRNNRFFRRDRDSESRCRLETNRESNKCLPTDHRFLSKNEINEVIHFTENMNYGTWWWDTGVAMHGLIEISKEYNDYNVYGFLQEKFDELEQNSADPRTAPLRRFPIQISDMKYVNDFPMAANLIHLNKAYPKDIYDDVLDISKDSLINWPERGKNPSGTFLHMYDRTNNGFEVYVWADTPYMISYFLIELYKETNNAAYLEIAIEQVLLHGNDLLDPSLNLFNHGFYEGNSNNGHDGRNGLIWGRGNGWPYLTLSMILEVMPTSHPDYNEVKGLFTDVSASLIAHQQNSGKWRQLIDDQRAYEENSATLMNSIGFIKGYRMGLLSQQYLDSAVKGIKSVTPDLSNGVLMGVCKGMAIKQTAQEYNSCATNEPTHFGQGFLLWAYAELTRANIYSL